MYLFVDTHAHIHQFAHTRTHTTHTHTHTPHTHTHTHTRTHTHTNTHTHTHTHTQDKWREASRDMASQSQRHITDLREEVGRLESRNRELNDKLAHTLASNASSSAKMQQQVQLCMSLKSIRIYTHTHTHIYMHEYYSYALTTCSPCAVTNDTPLMRSSHALTRHASNQTCCPTAPTTCCYQLHVSGAFISCTHTPHLESCAHLLH